MNKKIIWIVVSLLCVLVLLGCAEPSPTPTTVKTVKVGFLMPLSGPTAMWGLPGLTGVNLYVDEVNAAGGIKVGDERYLLEIVKYDSEGVPSIALLGARKLVLEDNVSMIIQPTGAEVTAVAPFATEQEMLVMGVCSDEVGPDLPYYLGVSENYPWYHGVSIQYIADNYPEVKRVAATVQDEKTGQHSMAWVMAGFEANDFDIVYSKFFGVDTTDFAPIASAILATNPDLISLCAMWPEYRALLLQELYLQGYTGMLESSEWEVTDILAVVPTEFMDGAVAHYPFITAPVLPPACHQFYEDWMARYGPGGPEDVHREIHSVDWNASIALRIWVCRYY
jgi:branched-chain amino acid transport system substrate-binding protein